VLFLLAGCFETQTQTKDIVLDDGFAEETSTDSSENAATLDGTKDTEPLEEREESQAGDIADELETDDLEDAQQDTAPVLCPEENLVQEDYTFQVSGDGLEVTEEVPFASLIGDGVVVERQYEGEMFLLKIALEGKPPISITSKLPHSYDVPVALGATARLFIARLKSGSFNGLAVVLWDKTSLNPVFFFEDSPRRGRWHQCSNEPKCPSLDLEIPDCAPLLDECGAIILPKVEIETYPSSKARANLRQGDEKVVENHRFIALAGYEYEANSCEDRPDVRVTAVFGESSLVSQCYCIEDADCANGFFCDKRSHKCLEDRCRADAVEGSSCKESFVCDPYRGGCTDPFKNPPFSCLSDADCPSGNICNHQMRLCSSTTNCMQEISVCVPDVCAIIDCAAPCDPLLGRCVGCLSDCDCQSAGLGLLCASDYCQQCDLAKIGFSKENPQEYELYEICIRNDEPEAWNKVMTIDPNLQCAKGSAGVFAKCDPSIEDRCMGRLDINHGLGNGKYLSDSAISALCELSQQGFVTKIAGGYYLR
jgi:Cys-rich repeat protein